MTEYPDNDIREALRAARDRQRAIPGDVVPVEMSDEQLLRAHDTAGQAGHLIEPGEFEPDEFEPDADGMPAGVGPSTTTPILLPNPPLLTAEQKARLDHLLAQRDNEETP